MPTETREQQSQNESNDVSEKVTENIEEEETFSEFYFHDSRKVHHCIATWIESCRLIPEAAMKSSNKAAAKMIARKLGVRIPTEYFVGDEVLVRLPDIRPGRRRKQKFFRLLTSLRGHVIEADPNRYRYRVEYDSSDGPSNRWFSVNDITSPTMQTERERNTSRASKCLMYSYVYSYVLSNSQLFIGYSSTKQQIVPEIAERGYSLDEATVQTESAAALANDEGNCNESFQCAKQKTTA